jgi:mRNA-degrading endonuclease toxin of MazEF toxin-antitoxin module
MQKDFDTWNEKKKIINVRQDTSTLFFEEREIWWCLCGLNVGYEQDGKGQEFLRPVLIIRKLSPNTFFGLPLTLKTRKHRYLVSCPASDNVYRQAALSQLKSLDIKRLRDRISFVSEESFVEIRKAVRELF